MKNVRTVVTALAATAILVAGSGLLACKKKEPETIKIGAILPLTGDAAEWGKNVQQGVDLAVEEINDSGGVLNKKIVVIYEDSKADPKVGVNGVKKLIEIEEVNAIIGAIASSVTLAAAPICEDNKVVLLSPGSTAPKISEAGDFIFRNWPSDAYEAEYMAGVFKGRFNYGNVALIYVNNDYGLGLKQAFVQAYEKKGGTVSVAEVFDPGATDFRAQMLKLKEEKEVEALYIISYTAETIALLKQIKEMGISIPLFGSVTMEDAQLLDKASDTAEGIIYPYPVPPGPDKREVKNFVDNFKMKYGKEPGLMADTGYDAMMMIKNAIEKEGGFDSDAIKRGLYKLKDYPGASGVMTFDENGDVVKPITLKIIENGEFVRLTEE